MIQYNNTHDEAQCCGCRACETVCNHSAIQMEKNEEGFLYPRVDMNACIECGMCNQVCPMEHLPSKEEPKAAYALINRNEEALLRSSSGGFFRLLSDYVINHGGYITGCLFDDNSRAVLKMSKDPSDILRMQGSKYVSSDPGQIYSEIKERLQIGQLVLFTGSPCQNAALINYLNRSYDNLITVDFLCHGMPSQLAFDSYKESISKKYHGQVVDFRFRDKSFRGWGLTESFLVNHRRHYRVGVTSTYLFGFTSGYLNRYSCYSCPFRGKRFTDFTISDYWGIKKHHSLEAPEKGVSAVTVNTLKAITIFETIKELAIYYPTQIDWIAEENPSVRDEHKETVPAIRRKIYNKIKNNGWGKTAKAYLICPHYYVKRLWYMIPSDTTKRIKKCVGKG